MDNKDNLTYIQWVKTEYIMSLITKQDTVTDFIYSYCEQVDRLTVDSFTATAQASYLKYCKENLNISEVVIVLDFSENYTFIVQNTVQGSFNIKAPYGANCATNLQATLHTIAIYLHSEVGKNISVLSMCIITDDLCHDSVAVYAHLH
ncbi:hypothetical protein PR048_013189 [Dryococelus australis]|uniref:Uncharacterized protein n=1 Tax=Dryococelus australis TaxID=614101 RepID=A0ABQ9HS74_9NEOP|nr:hypothetical protein PR048_013189 [Dryococelus australis]